MLAPGSYKDVVHFDEGYGHGLLKSPPPVPQGGRPESSTSRRTDPDSSTLTQTGNRLATAHVTQSIPEVFAQVISQTPAVFIKPPHHGLEHLIDMDLDRPAARRRRPRGFRIFLAGAARGLSFRRSVPESGPPAGQTKATGANSQVVNRWRSSVRTSSVKVHRSSRSRMRCSCPKSTPSPASVNSPGANASAARPEGRHADGPVVEIHQEGEVELVRMEETLERRDEAPRARRRNRIHS